MQARNHNEACRRRMEEALKAEENPRWARAKEARGEARGSEAPSGAKDPEEAPRRAYLSKSHRDSGRATSRGRDAGQTWRRGVRSPARGVPAWSRACERIR